MTIDNTSKIISLVVVCMITLGAVTVFAADSILGRPIPDVISTFVYTIMGAALGFSLHSLGVQSGAAVVMTNNKSTDKVS
jgi:hypothetical protein